MKENYADQAVAQLPAVPTRGRMKSLRRERECGAIKEMKLQVACYTFQSK